LCLQKYKFYPRIIHLSRPIKKQISLFVGDIDNFSIRTTKKKKPEIAKKLLLTAALYKKITVQPAFDQKNDIKLKVALMKNIATI
jgi:hypothetical protein